MRPIRPPVGVPGLVALTLLLLAGCGGDRTPRGSNGDAPPFVFRSLNLRQQDLLGRPTWQLASPEARYDLRRRVAQVDQLRGVIFREGKPAYRLIASSGTMLNDGQVLLLEGGIRLEQLGSTPMLLRAERARWYPSRNLLELDRRPEAFDAGNRLASRRASFRFDSNHLQLREQPLLLHWTLPFNPLKALPSGAAELAVQVSHVDWYPIRGTLSARGPLRAERRPPGRAATLPAARLTASALEGNTSTRRYRLLSPVRYQDPVEPSTLQALDVDLDLGAQLISAAGPFQATRGALRISGQGFRVDQGQTQLSIAAGCQLLQAGDALQAERCSWNWTSQAVSASGAVELRRQQNQQLSRGGWLVGRLGPDGAMLLRNPEGRVFSRFVVPHRPAPPRLMPPPPAVEPIRL